MLVLPRSPMMLPQGTVFGRALFSLLDAGFTAWCRFHCLVPGAESEIQCFGNA